jgi:hypothetical protein
MFFPLLTPLALVRVVSLVVALQFAFPSETYAARFARVWSVALMDDAIVRDQMSLLTKPLAADIAIETSHALVDCLYVPEQIARPTKPPPAIIANELPLRPPRLAVGRHRREKTTLFTPHAPRINPSQRRRITTLSARAHSTRKLQNQLVQTAATRQSRTTVSISLPGAAAPLSTRLSADKMN